MSDEVLARLSVWSKMQMMPLSPHYTLLSGAGLSRF